MSAQCHEYKCIYESFGLGLYCVLTLMYEGVQVELFSAFKCFSTHVTWEWVASVQEPAAEKKQAFYLQGKTYNRMNTVQRRRSCSAVSPATAV